MSKSNKAGRGSVLEKTKQFESLSDATEEPEPKEEQDTTEGEDDATDFADLVRNLTGDGEDGLRTNNEALKEAFKVLDYDEDGFISVSDLKNALEMFDDEDEKSGTPDGDPENEEETVKDMIAEADFDGDGKISFEDFLKVLTKDDEAEEPPNPQDKKKKRKKPHKTNK